MIFVVLALAVLFITVFVVDHFSGCSINQHCTVRRNAQVWTAVQQGSLAAEIVINAVYFMVSFIGPAILIKIIAVSGNSRPAIGRCTVFFHIENAVFII